MVLTGRYDYTLDSKNRLVVPPTFRDLLVQEKGTHFMLALGMDGDLYLFLPSLWEQYQADVKEIAKAMKDKTAARAAQHRLFSTAEPVELDDQGRILVPERHKVHAKLKKDVVIAGAGNKATIWDSAAYEKYEDQTAKPAFDTLSKELGI